MKNSCKWQRRQTERQSSSLDLINESNYGSRKEIISSPVNYITPKRTDGCARALGGARTHARGPAAPRPRTGSEPINPWVRAGKKGAHLNVINLSDGSWCAGVCVCGVRAHDKDRCGKGCARATENDAKVIKLLIAIRVLNV